ncbi:hypothetical protein E5288_WYG000529 [Bos mutus]|uniref:Uncharacterized protein n=1 Tax=Bos mutus TaxID=72004 RepID=A0A6B0QQ12_9CETA|nr:hypothetical protein [Bos mutus]
MTAQLHTAFHPQDSKKGLKKKKIWKKEEKRLATITLASSENSSAPEECEEKSERPKKVEKTKVPGGFLGEWNGRIICLLLQIQEKEIFFQGGARSKSFPKKEPVGDPEKSENKRVPKKKKKFSSKEEPPSRGSEEAAPNNSSSFKKKEKAPKAISGKLEWTSP